MHHACARWLFRGSAFLVGFAEPAATQVLPRVPSWTLSRSPVTRVSDDGSEHTQWRRIVGAVRLPEGDVLIADADAVRRFAGSGRFVRLEIRSGDGPSELPEVASLLPVGLGAVAVSSNASIVLGAAPRTKRLLQSGGGPPAGLIDAVFLDGSFVQRRTPWALLSPPTRVVRDSATLALFGSAGVPLTITQLPNATGIVLASASLTRGIGFRVMDGAPQLRVTGRDSVLWIGSTDQDSLMRITVRNGRVVQDQRVHVQLPVLPWSELRRASWQSFTVQRAQRSYEKILAEAAWSTRWLPGSAPRFRSLVSDQGGGVWVELFPERPDIPTHWLVLNAIGRAVAKVTIPRDARLLHVDAAHVVVAALDENDVEYVAVYALTRR